MSNFDKSFEGNKIEFKKKFGVDWNKNPELYLSYLQTLYLSTITEIANTGLGRVIGNQERINDMIKHVSQQLDK